MQLYSYTYNTVGFAEVKRYTMEIFILMNAYHHVWCRLIIFKDCCIIL